MLLSRAIPFCRSVRLGSHSDVLRYVSAVHLFPIPTKNAEVFSKRHFSVAKKTNDLLKIAYNSGQRNKDHLNLLQLTRKAFSSESKSNKKKGKNFQLDALPFTVSPDQALASFKDWSTKEQGLSYLLSWQSNSVKINASYVPVWSFDVNVRFARFTSTKNRAYYDWKPPPFDKSHANGSVIYLPGLAAYGGYSYRRSLINPIHNSSLVYLGDQAKPFQSWMLDDIIVEKTNERLKVFPDPWNATKERAFSSVRDDLEAIVEAVKDTLPKDSDRVEVQVEKVSYRRVYMPTYVINYSILGMEYSAFLSGCDVSSGVSGVSHQVFNITSQDMGKAYDTTRSILTNFSYVASAASQGLGRNFIGSIFMFLLNVMGNVAARFLVRLPLVGMMGGAFVGFRKIIQPWMDNRSASADWERQRDHEQYVNEDHLNDFLDDFSDVRGEAKRYFQQNKKRIFNQWNEPDLSKENDFDWYSDWEKWSRQQWEKEQRYQSNNREQQYQRKQTSSSSSSSSKRSKQYSWDFDPSDPYSVLGIHRGASAREVSTAFRKEMLKHHPDVQSGASSEEKERAIERSKYITEAYRKIKTEMKNK